MNKLESVIRVNVGRWTVRIWREEYNDFPTDYSDIDAVTRILLGTELMRGKILEAYQRLPRVNSVEVLNSNGDGIVVHNETRRSV